MAIRQYIGARYVPRFLGLYDASQIYEALDVVDNGSGTSYIAKKTVPAGTPLTSTEYWFVYGASSGAIIDLNTKVNKLITEMSQLMLDQRKFVFIGDSYGDEAYLSNVLGWWRKIVEYLGIDAANYFVKCTAGAGFNRPTTYLSEIEYLADNVITDHDAITDIVIAGGYNDREDNYASILSALGAIKTYVNTAFPNANIWLSDIGWTSVLNGTKTVDLVNVSIWYKRAAARTGINYIDNAYLALHDYTDFKDEAHPKTSGNEKIAEVLAEGLLGNEIIPQINWTGQTLTAPSTGSFYGSPLFRARMDGHIVTYELSRLQVNFDSAISIEMDGINTIDIGSFADGIIKGDQHGYNFGQLVSCAYHPVGEGYVSVPSKIIFNNNHIYLAPLQWDGNGYKTVSIDRIYITQLMGTIDACQC